MPVIANNIGGDAYNKYVGLSDFPYNCYVYLINNNETVWKLLKYDDPDAYKKANLTFEEKGLLIYNGEEDETKFRAFMDQGQPSSWVFESTVLRISLHSIKADNRTVGTVRMLFEVYTHYKINHLSNYKTRNDYILEELLSTFNGVQIGGIGNLFFDGLGDYPDRVITSGQLPHKGKWLLMSNRIA